jgi:hypothetical protein
MMSRLSTCTRVSRRSVMTMNRRFSRRFQNTEFKLLFNPLKREETDVHLEASFNPLKNMEQMLTCGATAK